MPTDIVVEARKVLDDPNLDPHVRHVLNNLIATIERLRSGEFTAEEYKAYLERK